MSKSQIEIAVEFLKERGWEFRPAQKIQGVFKPVGKYDAKNPVQKDFSIYSNKSLKTYAYYISLAESQGETWRYV
jgi:predicted transcriptional regulator|tara:strand:- start:51 stop:275 length:225 start_codon:yes stop_codon:yes gene_type:complete